MHISPSSPAAALRLIVKAVLTAVQYRAKGYCTDLKSCHPPPLVQRVSMCRFVHTGPCLTK